MAPLIVQLTFLFAYAVLAEATLSFLGVGAAAADATWGNIIAEAATIREARWIMLFPGHRHQPRRAGLEPARRRAARRARPAAEGRGD